MLRRHLHLLVWLLILLSLVSLMTDVQAANRRHSLKYENITRDYFVHIPPNKKDRLPLVINLHGGGSHGRGQEEFSNMDKTADTYGFYVVYPNGTGKSKNRLLTWNAGICCGYAQEKNIDDVGFISKVMDAVIKDYPIDATRVYVTGMSNGAMMAYYLAEKLPERIAAIAPVAAGVMPQTGKTLKPMPIMHIHSVDDPRAIYQGGLGPNFPGTNHRAMHANIDQLLASWANINGCSSERKQVDLRTYQKDKKSHIAHKYVYQDCKQAPVILWQLEKSGHVWPGGRQNYKERTLGESTRVINANEEMWLFFKDFKLATH